MNGIHILREQTIGETRWAIVDSENRPAGLYIERHTDVMPLGAVLQGRIGKTELGSGGTFIDIPGTTGAFLRTSQKKQSTPPSLPSEGSAVTVEIISEARGDKVPRVRLAKAGAERPASGAAAWLNSFCGAAEAVFEDVPPGDARIESFFSDAIDHDVVLPGGGKLRLERTHALTAADIDTSGRTGRGSAGARALSLNREAAQELARQILIRGLGGLVVLDCVGPTGQEAGVKIRDAYLKTWTGLTQRTVRVLPPSPLGLMELACDWQITPLAERMFDRSGLPTPETIALEGIRRLQGEASQNRLARLTLALPDPAYTWLAASALKAADKLAAQYGARLTITSHNKTMPEVFTTP